MKRIALAAATALMLAGPLASTASAQVGNAGGERHNTGRNDDRGRGDVRGDRGNDGSGRGDNRGDRGGDNRGDRGNDNRGRGDNTWDRNDRGDRGRGDNRWNDARNNGYSYNGRWYYGPPQASHRGYQPGYRAWRRGERLPSYYQNRYRQVDYRREHLRAPPRGYHYVRDDRGDYLLVGIATGVILGIILSQ